VKHETGNKHSTVSFLLGVFLRTRTKATDVLFDDHGNRQRIECFYGSTAPYESRAPTREVHEIRPDETLRRTGGSRLSTDSVSELRLAEQTGGCDTEEKNYDRRVQEFFR